jgi:hypothetical protein
MDSFVVAVCLMPGRWLMSRREVSLRLLVETRVENLSKLVTHRSAPSPEPVDWHSSANFTRAWEPTLSWKSITLQPRLNAPRDTHVLSTLSSEKGEGAFCGG